jgi:hypothetical protein
MLLQNQVMTIKNDFIPDPRMERGGGCKGPVTRVSTKQTNKIFASNRNKPKPSLFRVIFGLFRETRKFYFRYFRLLSVF